MRADGIEGSAIEDIGWLETYFDGPRVLLEQMDCFHAHLEKATCRKMNLKGQK